MSDFHTVARVGEIPPGEGRCFHVAGKLIAVFHVDGEYFALNDICPHMGASLSQGYVEEGAVYCPWHAWRFCVRDGTWLDNPRSSVRTESYPVRVEAGEIQVDVSAPTKPEPADSRQDESRCNP
jgi:nitrite reductase (NADH) small subunit